MQIFIVYAHPSDDSFTRHVRDSFINGAEQAGHVCTISDLYAMDFRTDISEDEYFRETNLRNDLPLPADVLVEHEKINSSDAIVFIYPLFWVDVPAKLKGWFDRVWTYGFAYGENRTMKTLDKGLVLCIAGHTLENLQAYGQLDSVKITMLDDRLLDRVRAKELVVFDGTSKFDAELRKKNWDKHLETAFAKGVGIGDKVEGQQSASSGRIV